jgi:serine/threonine protein kinase
VLSPAAKFALRHENTSRCGGCGIECPAGATCTNGVCNCPKDHIVCGTEPGTLKGKFFYMSPEMILAKPVDHRADVFATGVMLYEQLCGRRPFTGNSIDEVVMRIAQGNPIAPACRL